MTAAIAPSHARPSLGLRLAPDAIPAIAWGRWMVTARTNGFHVSRESASGQHVDVLKNEVRKTKVFRSLAAAEKACAKANFDATAERLKQEPVMGGKGGVQ